MQSNEESVPDSRSMTDDDILLYRLGRDVAQARGEQDARLAVTKLFELLYAWQRHRQAAEIKHTATFERGRDMINETIDYVRKGEG